MLVASRSVPGDAPGSETRVRQPSVEAGWRSLGWFGLLLSIVGAVDIGLVWYPLGFGNPAWEFAVVDQSFASLPLLTMGLAAALASSLALGAVGRIRLIAAVLIALALVLLAAFALYLSSVPVALGMAPAEVAIGVKKAIVKTTVMALAFPALYLIASIAALRSTRKRG